MLLVAAPYCAGTLAEEPAAGFAPQIWVNPGVYSIHFDRSKDFREDNTGIGAELLLTDTHVLMAGTFINSDRQRSHYGAYQWRPLHWQAGGMNVSAGIAAGAFDGYPHYHDGGWFVAALPMLAVEGERFGLNLMIVPSIANRLSGAVAIQLKLRLR